MLEIVNAEVGVWIPEQILGVQAAQEKAIMVELGEALVPLRVAEDFGLRSCIIDEFDPGDPFIGGGLVWLTSDFPLGCTLSSALGSVVDWPLEPREEEVVIWIGPDTVGVERSGSRVAIHEKWGKRKEGAFDVRLYQELLARATREYRRFIELILATPDLDSEESGVLKSVL